MLQDGGVFATQVIGVTTGESCGFSVRKGIHKSSSSTFSDEFAWAVEDKHQLGDLNER